MLEAESLFGKTAQELCDIREKSEEDFMQLVQSLQFTERLWTVAAKEIFHKTFILKSGDCRNGAGSLH